jgi:hypothetical protein
MENKIKTPGYGGLDVIGTPAIFKVGRGEGEGLIASRHSCVTTCSQVKGRDVVDVVCGIWCKKR